MLVQNKKNILNVKGQAIFEFIVFLPILLILYAAIMSIGSAINGSINQQKAVRGFAMAQIKGSPNIPIRRQILTLNQDQAVTILGMLSYVWSARLEGESPVAACYRVPLFGLTDSEECDAVADEIGEVSPFIRPKSAFGVCGATYVFNPKITMDFNIGAQTVGCQAIAN